MARRHKRLRPSWLPRWIPYKDGRYLGLARQTLLAWLSTILALVFFLMTVAYATEKSRFSGFKFVHDSPSNTILVLRILSEATGVFLAGSIHSTFEVVQWVLISRPEGIRLSQFLALQSGTGHLGLFVLACGRGLPASQWPMKPRIMSLIRLIAELACPVLGVLIMSNVDTYPVYRPIQETITPFAVGMEPFNGSVASQLGVMEDILFNNAYVAFLSNPLHAVVITPSSAKREGCEKGVAQSNDTSCTRNVLITQEYQNLEAGLPFTQNLDTQVFVSTNQQVYSLEYRDNIDISRNALVCNDFHSGPGAYQICTSDGGDDWLHAAVIPCPASLVDKNDCRSDLKWQRGPGFTTALRPSFANATVSYDRRDGRILSHKLETSNRPVKIDSSEILTALDHILNATTLLDYSSMSNSILGGQTHFFGRMVAGHMYRISKMMKTNPTARPKAVNAIQSLLAMTLFYCQNGVLAQTTLPFSPGSNGTSAGGDHVGAFAQQEKSSFVALADTRYRINISRATLLAYIIMGGLALAICTLALVVGSILELIKFDAEPTLWPALDFWTQCRVETSDGVLVPAQKRADMAWIRSGRELFKEIETLRVTRRKRKLREWPGMNGPEPEGLG
ncbi:hypothetical protein CC78DRAFT_570995 [Lojkania enalia]|uniref:Uncharacterized protein n=1 Tax=Lojkania enalia TaxID=147567 RepID=A0A9P4K626_9PLEO|nr:hypothetical protein CC78DRAFT_570995 [Didymosphaeria enalia]